MHVVIHHINYFLQGTGQVACAVYAKNCTSLDFHGDELLADFVQRGIDENRRNLHKLLSTEHGHCNDDNDDEKSTTLPRIPVKPDDMKIQELKSLIPKLVKVTTGRGKPLWNDESKKPRWWPDGLPYKNPSQDFREADKRTTTWTTILRNIVKCYLKHR